MHSDIAYALIEYTHICEQVIALLRILILRAYISLYGKKVISQKALFFLMFCWYADFSVTPIYFFKKNDNLLLVFDCPTAFLTLHHFDQYVQ